jgi:hypothetical protein
MIYNYILRNGVFRRNLVTPGNLNSIRIGLVVGHPGLGADASRIADAVVGNRWRAQREGPGMRGNSSFSETRTNWP